MGWSVGWLRENWLDVLILVLSALVVAEVVLYLLGVHPLPFRSALPSEGVSEVQEAVPSLPLPPIGGDDPVPSSQEEATEPGVEGEVSSASLPRGDGEQEERQERTILPIPQAPAEVEPSLAPAAGPREVPKAQSATSGSGKPAKGTRVWRVAVGSFANPENALRLSRELSAKGFPVRLEAVGRYTRVVVGPYASEEEARRVAQALAEYAPQVYRGERPPSCAYFQVGAFKEGENALALAAKLREAGFFVVLRKDGLYRVLVGPVARGKEEDVRRDLEELGFIPLEVR